jgi:hypothetical protein
MLFGATVDVFLLKEDVWRDNAFFYALRESWPVGPLMLVAVLCIVMVAKRRLTARTDEPAAASADNVPASAR